MVDYQVLIINHLLDLWSLSQSSPSVSLTLRLITLTQRIEREEEMAQEAHNFTESGGDTFHPHML